jgi:hypothetical protein
MESALALYDTAFNLLSVIMGQVFSTGLLATGSMKDTKHYSSPSMLVNYWFMDLLSIGCLNERQATRNLPQD